MKGLYSIGLLVVSNVFMTLAWYGHLKFKDWRWFEQAGLFVVILISWGLAFFEYCFQVPANRIGYSGNAGPFSMIELKVIQEVISLLVFTFFRCGCFLKRKRFDGITCLDLYSSCWPYISSSRNKQWNYPTF